jgi:hypothetical protein
VQTIDAKLRTAINSYNARAGSVAITVNDVRRRFFARVLNAGQPHRTTLTAAFISYLLEWDYKSALVGLTERGSREPFFVHLFRGCLLFESLLKDNPLKTPRGGTLGPILKRDLFAELGISANMPISSPRFDTIIRSLAVGQPVAAAIECTAKVRNTLGHNLAWQASSLDETNYNLLADSIATSCLHAISCLYK